jgi:uncharacterized protein (TIGR03435 family)
MKLNPYVTRGWTVVVSTAVLIAILAVPAVADRQREALAQERLGFEAATIKPAAPDAPRNRVMPTSPNRLYIPSMTLVWLIYTAYGDGGFNTAMRVTGGPEWVNTTAFAVEGVASANVTPRQRRLMLQTLLEERFALKLRTQIQNVDMNVLVVERRDGALGPKVKEWNRTCRNGTPSPDDEPAMPRCLSGYRPGGITLDGATMFSVAEVLSLPQARALLGGLTGDGTGLKGRYTMDLDYEFAPPRPLGAAAAPEFAGPALSTAIREQWGLRIQPGQAPFRLVVVESAQLPPAN